MANLKSTKTKAITASVLVIGLGLLAWQQIEVYNARPVSVNPEALRKQSDLAESIYSRNVQGISLAEAVAKNGGDRNLLAAVRSWSRNLEQNNTRIRSWFSEVNLPLHKPSVYAKDYNLPQGQLKTAITSFDTELMLDTINNLAAKGQLARDAKVERQEKLFAILDSVLQADFDVQLATNEYLEK